MYDDVVLMDGGVGTSLWEKIPEGEEKVLVWRYNMEKPEIVRELHQEMLDAGAQIILANTFGANQTNMRGTDYTPAQAVKAAMELAHEVIGNKAKIALAVGPLTGLLKPYGKITKEEAYAYFDEQISTGAAGKPDLIYCQTFMDLEMMKIAASVARKFDLPLFCSFTFDRKTRTMMGNTVQSLIDGMAEFHPEAIGLNCSFGPDQAMPVMEEFAQETDIPLILKPNAGKLTIDADGKPLIGFGIETFSDDVIKALPLGIKYIGGCCGANAAYIKRLGEKLKAAQGK